MLVLLFFLREKHFFYFKNSLLFSLLSLELVTLFVLYVCCTVISAHVTSMVLTCFFLCFAASGAAVGCRYCSLSRCTDDM
uniref:NADH dehydrogenase subunit 4L n=1 Tax=Cepaea nemoralis TaxID=28835 RepID=Q34178_CEPNE|nr:NADH dehydrogenase subunit 4L [Cepaea nemoralis]